MSNFDPNDEPDTQEQADAYITWCADQFMRLSEGPKRDYRTAVRCAHWLFVVASAQLHLDDDVTQDTEALMAQLAMYSQLGRALERQHESFPVERLIVLRASLDCWEASAEWGGNLLSAAKCAVSALILIDVHPLMDLWELECPDVWSLLAEGRDYLAAINVEEDLTFRHFSVRPHEMVSAKFTWQRANNLTRHLGMPPLSPN